MIEILEKKFKSINWLNYLLFKCLLLFSFVVWLFVGCLQVHYKGFKQDFDHHEKEGDY